MGATGAGALGQGCRVAGRPKGELGKGLRAAPSPEADQRGDHVIAIDSAIKRSRRLPTWPHRRGSVASDLNRAARRPHPCPCTSHREAGVNPPPCRDTRFMTQREPHWNVTVFVRVVREGAGSSSSSLPSLPSLGWRPRLAMSRADCIVGPRSNGRADP
jgi:hypothetical protein